MASASLFSGEVRPRSVGDSLKILAASVINVLPNGHLVVAGERGVAMNGGTSTLRFSGIENPRDIRPGNIVPSGDAVNARVELVGQGDVSEAANGTGCSGC